MAYTPTIHNWRSIVAPINQIFRAGGEAVRGGVTLGGAIIEHPEPGGRAELHMDFAVFATTDANLDASWTISRITNGSVMRIPLFNTVQLVSGSDLGVPNNALLWSNGQVWSNGQPWDWKPTAPVFASALQGEVNLVIDMSGLNQALKMGHVFGIEHGIYNFAHKVMNVDYVGDIATCEISPPLRRDVSALTVVEFRPFMLVQCVNSREVMSNYNTGRHMQLNSAKFVEAMV